MTPVALAACWVGIGILATVAAGRRRHRLAVLAPVAGLGLTLLVQRGDGWAGPAASASFGAVTQLGRAEWGMLLAVAAACALNLLLAPHLDGGEALSQTVAIAAAVLLLSATVPLVWGIAAVVGMAAVAVRWINAAPGRATLAAGRVPLLGAAAVLGAAAFVPAVGPPVDQRTALAGGLLAGGTAAMLALMPLGGWAAGAASTLRGVDYAAWGLLVAPPTVIAAAVLIPTLQTATRLALEDTLLVVGAGSAVYAAALALRVDAGQRYQRLLAADLALAASGVGSTHVEGVEGALLILLSHLVVGPLMLNGGQRGLRLQHRLTWMTVCGLPPTPLFWGRYLVLLALSLTHADLLLAGLVAAGLLFFASVRVFVGAPAREPEHAEAAAPARIVAWLIPLAALAIGLAPHTASQLVFGS